MNDQEIINYSSNNLEEFESVIHNCSEYDIKGIINSELLLFCSIVKEEGITSIIESGRTRACSTEIIGKFFQNTNVKIKSIEFDQKSEDTDVALKKLENVNNAELLFGDSFKVIPTVMGEEKTAMIIDGPKGLYALKLAFESLINYPNLSHVFLHDMHKDGYIARPIIEKFFPESTFFSDDNEFVNKFKHLDKDCWTRMKEFELTRGWKPYKRRSQRMQSYFSTLCCIYRSESFSESELKEALRTVNKHIKITQRLTYRLLKRFLFRTSYDLLIKI